MTLLKKKKKKISWGYEIHFPVSHTPSLSLAWKARKKSTFLSHFLRTIMGCSEMALYPFEVLPSIWKRSQESKCVFVSNKTCALTSPRQDARTRASPNAPLASLSPVYEYPRKTILQTPQLGKGVMLPCTSPLVTKNNCTYKRKRLWTLPY